MDSSTTHNHSAFNSPNIHTPSNPHFVYHDIENPASPSVSTRASLPTLQSTMYAQESFNLGPMRPASSNTSRRSVSGMKQLLPLKLASSPVSDIDSSSTSRPALTKRTTFGQSGRVGGLSNSGRIAERRLAGISRLAIRPTSFRDTPVISKPTVPFLGSPLFQDSCTKCSDEVACTTSCIIDEYEGFSDSSSSGGDGSDYSNHHTQSAASSAISSRRHYRPDSDFSFKCLGEPNPNSGSSWLGSPLKPRAVPRLSTLDIEEWLGDSESMCGSSDDEDSGDFFACATALSPAKAQVVQVNHKQSPRLSITIPPRSTSIAKFKQSDSSALRKLTSRSPIKTSLVDDLAMSSPPTSPEPTYQKVTMNQGNVLHSPIDLSPTEFSPTPASPDTILDIVAAIEESTSNFPSKMLLVDTPCISSIRSHLKATSVTNVKSTPPPPPPSTTTFNQFRPKGLNRRNRPQTICLSPTSKSKSSNSQIPTTPPSTPPFSPDFSISSFPSKNKSNATKSTNKSSTLPTFSYQLAAANLQPLHAIFPISSDFLRSALYAHILAYIFLQSLPSTDPTSSSSQLHQTTSTSNLTSTSKPHPPYLKKQPSYNPSFSYHNTSIVGIPAKAASTLGLSISTSNSSRRNGNGNGHGNGSGSGNFDLRGNAAKAAQNKRIEHNLRTCIAKLLKGMQGRVDVDPRDVSGNEVEGWVLRSLIEVVRGCEGI
ncbi:f443e6e4-cae2-4cc2-88ff-16b21717a4b9 [Sclerotinia trifoliorum]|uniref:F443e6e4-cae2-4cc2-88ff-16b21717a4b9 n=1 Tax=Sclerotinia trifoliorum TaxID=28548 RepID=A0A8H2W1Y7_9HELO|nr:f443e6e4-cae2-4cc2-88ff-16b21717a4b9 [Sclerotinia trifoliorum]